MSTSPTINPTEVWPATTSIATLPYSLGQVGYDHLGRKFRFCRADGVLAANALVRLEDSGSEEWEANPSANGELAWGVANTALADNEFGWIQVGGRVNNAKVATSVSVGQLLCAVADSNLRFNPVIDVDEGGATAHGVGVQAGRAVALTAESSNLADIYLFDW